MIPSGALRPSCRGLRCPAVTPAHPLFDSPDGKSIGYFEQSSVSGPVGVGGCAQRAFAPGPTRDPGPSHQAAPLSRRKLRLFLPSATAAFSGLRLGCSRACSVRPSRPNPAPKHRPVNERAASQGLRFVPAVCR